MIHEIKPYPTYRDSGVEWLEMVPEDWLTKPLKRCVTINGRTLEEDTNPSFRFRYIDIGTVGPGRLVQEPQRTSFGDAPSRARRVLRRGDTIVSTVRTYLKAVWFVREDANDLIASTGFAVLSPDRTIDPEYLGYAIQSDSFVARVVANSVGVAYPAISETALGRLQIAVPPLDQQSAIIRFLDHVDRRIRRYIRSKQKLIALLHEQRQAIIHRAVTRGLDPDVRLKPSGVEWLGDVPEHWRVLRVKDMARLRSGDSITSLTISDTGRYPVYGGNNVRGFTSAYTHEGEFVLIGRQGALCGNVNYARGQFWASEHAVVAHPRQSYGLIWFGELLRIMNLNQYSMSAAQPGLSVERIQNLQLPVPPADEQARIAHYLESATAGPKRGVVFAHKEIALLREFRTRLISDVVTGKLDVREAATRLPPEAEEPEPLDDTDTSPEVITEETEAPDPDALEEAEA